MKQNLRDKKTTNVITATITIIVNTMSPHIISTIIN